jgi:hypothetical protein
MRRHQRYHGINRSLLDPAFEFLEKNCFEVILVKARYASDGPGRKTDVNNVPGRCDNYISMACCVAARIELPPEIRTLTQATICRLLIFDKKEIRDVETEAARA